MSVRTLKRSTSNKPVEITVSNEQKNSEQVSNDVVSAAESSSTRKISRRNIERKVNEVGEKKTLSKVEKSDDVLKDDNSVSVVYKTDVKEASVNIVNANASDPFAISKKEHKLDPTDTIEEAVSYDLKQVMHNRDFNLDHWYNDQVEAKIKNGETISDKYAMFNEYLNHLSHNVYLNCNFQAL